MVGGHEVPEAVVTSRTGIGVSETPTPQAQPDEVEAEVAGAKRRATAQPIPEP